MDDGSAFVISPASAELVDRGDLNEITPRVQGLVLDGNWEELAGLRRACLKAFERGKQLWPAAAYIEYRLCLDGPGPWAATMLEEGSGRFALGPLPEVAACKHTWAELAPHLRGTPAAAMAAHERVMRGEDLSRDAAARALPDVLDLSLVLQAWEPTYEVAEYGPDKVEVPSPALPSLQALGREPPPPAGPGRADEVTRALDELASVWVNESNGRCQAVTVEGSALQAVFALGARPDGWVALTLAQAVAAMAWAGASGGAYGRRRGAAPGRFGAWCVLAALTGLADEWPLPGARLGGLAGSLRWYAWAGHEPSLGWELRLAVEADDGPDGRRAWAVSASDAR